MPISLIPKRKERKGLDMGLILGNKSAAMAAAPLLIVIFIYGGLFAYSEYLKGNIEDIKNKVEEIQTQRDSKAEDDVVALDFKLSQLSAILDDHVYSDKLFDFIEANTHPRVQFIDMSFEEEISQVALSGLTASYSTFGEQLIALGQKEEITELSVSDVELAKSGQISFAISFKVAESLYHSSK